MPQADVSRGRCTAVPRLHGLRRMNDGPTLCVDTFKHSSPGMARFRELCPFTLWPDAVFPVPGHADRSARSLEGIWQGLKIVDGRCDLAQLHTSPYKRPPDDQRGYGYDYAASRFRYGRHELGLLDARLLIYVPAYVHLLEHLVSDELLGEIESVLAEGRDVVFFDWDSNFDIDDCRYSFSHSALLAAWFNGEIGSYRDRSRQLEKRFTEEWRGDVQS